MQEVLGNTIGTMSIALVPPFCPSLYDSDFNRVVKCQKVCVGSGATLAPALRARALCSLAVQSPGYVVRSPGEYILRESSLNKGGRKLAPSGMPMTYLGM